MHGGGFRGRVEWCAVPAGGTLALPLGEVDYPRRALFAQCVPALEQHRAARRTSRGKAGYAYRALEHGHPAGELAA